MRDSNSWIRSNTLCQGFVWRVPNESSTVLNPEAYTSKCGCFTSYVYGRIEDAWRLCVYQIIWYFHLWSFIFPAMDIFQMDIETKSRLIHTWAIMGIANSTHIHTSSKVFQNGYTPEASWISCRCRSYQNRESLHHHVDMAAIRRAGAEGAGEVQHYAGLMRQDARKKDEQWPSPGWWTGNSATWFLPESNTYIYVYTYTYLIIYIFITIHTHIYIYMHIIVDK